MRRFVLTNLLTSTKYKVVDSTISMVNCCLLVGSAAAALIATTTLSYQPIGCIAFSFSSYHPHRVGVTTTTQLLQSSSSTSEVDTLDQIKSELNELSECSSIVYNYLSKPEKDVSVEDVILACDAVDEAAKSSDDDDDAGALNKYFTLRQKSHEFGRYHLLVKLLKSDYDAYIKTAEFLSPSRIDRKDLPNVQDVTFVLPSSSSSESEDSTKSITQTSVTGEDGQQLVADCELQDLSYNDSPLDKLLLSIFRKLVTENTDGVTSNTPGIKGLLEQGRQYMTMELPEGVTYADHTKAQHTMVKNTLGGLMTPVLPPFYRIFMSGIVPKLGTDYDGKQIGPWFYAPWLTSMVTPTFFGFLVGPSYPNRRSDGQRGGLVVEKCKFLQESGCKVSSRKYN